MAKRQAEDRVKCVVCKAGSGQGRWGNKVWGGVGRARRAKAGMCAVRACNGRHRQAGRQVGSSECSSVWAGVSTNGGSGRQAGRGGGGMVEAMQGRHVRERRHNKAGTAVIFKVGRHGEEVHVGCCRRRPPHHLACPPVPLPPCPIHSREPDPKARHVTITILPCLTPHTQNCPPNLSQTPKYTWEETVGVHKRQACSRWQAGRQGHKVAGSPHNHQEGLKRRRKGEESKPGKGTKFLHPNWQRQESVCVCVKVCVSVPKRCVQACSSVCVAKRCVCVFMPHVIDGEMVGREKEG